MNNLFLPLSYDTSESLFAKYWISNEIAKYIIKEYEELIDECLYIFAEETKISHRNYLTQLLKKEWYR